MGEKSFNLFNDNPTLITHCSVCSLRYEPLEANILEEGENAHLIYIRCRRCQTSIIAILTAGSLGISSVGLITDLSGDDVLKFKSAKPINCDQVIEAHQFLVKEKISFNHFN